MTIFSAESSFSKLKPVKTALRSTMRETHLSSLVLRSIEITLSDKVNFNSVIDSFSCLKNVVYLYDLKKNVSGLN